MQTFPKVEAYADIANTSFEFPCSLEIFYQMKTNHDVLTQRVSVEWVVFARREDKENWDHTSYLSFLLYRHSVQLNLFTIKTHRLLHN